jgi:PIN domain nuclease of toxin-antitoxin system
LRSLLDTHFLLWVVLDSGRLEEFPWLQRYRPWGVSPVSFLEIQFLAEVGKLAVDSPSFSEAVMADARFLVDEVPLLALIRQALASSWTRDPFDRLLTAHSTARRVPLCTVDDRIRANHSLLIAELR